MVKLSKASCPKSTSGLYISLSVRSCSKEAEVSCKASIPPEAKALESLFMMTVFTSSVALPGSMPRKIRSTGANSLRPIIAPVKIAVSS